MDIELWLLLISSYCEQYTLQIVLFDSPSLVKFNVDDILKRNNFSNHLFGNELICNSVTPLDIVLAGKTNYFYLLIEGNNGLNRNQIDGRKFYCLASRHQ